MDTSSPETQVIRPYLLCSGNFGMATAALLQADGVKIRGQASAGFTTRPDIVQVELITLICSNSADALLVEYDAWQVPSRPALLALTLNDWEMQARFFTSAAAKPCTVCRDIDISDAPRIGARELLSKYFRENPEEQVHPYPPPLASLAAHWISETWRNSHFGLHRDHMRRYSFWTAEVHDRRMRVEESCAVCGARSASDRILEAPNSRMMQALAGIWDEAAESDAV